MYAKLACLLKMKTLDKKYQGLQKNRKILSYTTKKVYYGKQKF